MRKQIMVANWKMNMNKDSATKLINEIKDIKSNIEVGVCPPFTLLSTVETALCGSSIIKGAQNLYHEEKGAYTGEISPDMLKDFGVSLVIVGHSERRNIFGESDDTVNKKAAFAIENGLTPIICVGESLEQRENGKANDFVLSQVKSAIKGLDTDKIIFAYEPIWAIGTGKTATPKEAEEMCALIRASVNGEVTVLYGGSMNDKNVKELMACPDIDGGLVGSASLVADKFIPMMTYDMN